MNRTEHPRAWWLVAPVLVVVAFSAVIPLMTVVNYSVQDIFGPGQRVFVGSEWFREVLRDGRLHAAFGRQLLFTAAILAIELPLGVAIARSMPVRGAGVSPSLVILALPLLIPWNVVGTIWLIFGRGDIGLGGALLQGLGLEWNYAQNAMDAWALLIVMDVWHWTSLVALLAYAGLRAIPEPLLQAARIDGASPWAIFRYVELPKLRGVLTIALLLRLMDSFVIYTEPFVLTGGGPGNATTFLSQYLAQRAVGQFDLGPAAAFSLIYFLIILVLCFGFFTALTAEDAGEAPDTQRGEGPA